MNFAQLIDPEWVQAGCPERYARRPVNLAEPLGVVTHSPPDDRHGRAATRGPRTGRRTGGTRKILEVLAEATVPMTCARLAQVVQGITAQQISNRLFNLHERECVARSGPRKAYAYSITAKGRGRL